MGTERLRNTTVTEYRSENRKSRSNEYLSYVRRFADALLSHGLDRYGTKHLPMWAGLIDTRNYAVPSSAESELTKRAEGYYDESYRRAVGGANLYHDMDTIRAFELLSKVTGDERYARAAREYLKATLAETQNSDTGLLGWGEHLYYDFYEDRVKVGPGAPLWHEFLAKTPVWDRLWQVDAQRTARAIEALRYHFRSPLTQTYLFNRHALWAKDTRPAPDEKDLVQYQYGEAMAWIKHSALLSYSFMFLYEKTHDAQWLKWSLGVGNLYWRYRDAVTNLTPCCIDCPNITDSKAFIEQSTYLAYWLYKASQLHPAGAELRTRALAMFNALDRYAWRAKGKYYYVGPMNLDGTEYHDESKFGNLPVLNVDFGRTAAYIARHEKDPRYLVIARRMIDIMDRNPLPKKFSAEEIASRIHLLIDVYDITHENSLLDLVERYADEGIAGLWRGGLFARRVEDPFYESKDGEGNFVCALLRLHLAQTGTTKKLASLDWSY